MMSTSLHAAARPAWPRQARGHRTGRAMPTSEHHSHGVRWRQMQDHAARVPKAYACPSHAGELSQAPPLPKKPCVVAGGAAKLRRAALQASAAAACTLGGAHPPIEPRMVTATPRMMQIQDAQKCTLPTPGFRSTR